MVVEPQGALKCRSSTIAVPADSAQFLRLLLSFAGPGVNHTIYEPPGALTCRISTLAVFVGSGQFHGPLLTILEPESNFHGC